MRSPWPISLWTKPNFVARTTSRATAFDGLADLDLRITINIGGIKKRDAQIQCAPDQRNRRVVVADAARVDVCNAEAHAPEANGRDAWPQAA